MITGLNIKNYKSFSTEGGDFPSLKKINIFIGKNNSGKSNILRFLDFLNQNREIKSGNILSAPPIIPDDYFNFEQKHEIQFTLHFDIPDSFGEKDEILAIAQNPFFSYKITANKYELVDSFLHKSDEQKIRDYVQQKFSIDGGAREERLNDLITKSGVQQECQLRPILFVDEFRKLKDNLELRKKINELKNHDYKNLQLGKKYEQLEKFASDIFGETVEIRIPDVNKEIELKIGGNNPLPLSSVGTGIHELIILAFYLVTADKSIVCLDEPELHLHPGIQRKFLEHISEKTNHQYFIATHSNNFLDYQVEKSIYSSKLKNNSTNISKCDDIQSTGEILSDLGIRASEILQTNGIIWIEGPSDRTYINKWLSIYCNKNKLDKPKEGFDYTFQYYGGAILYHYSVDDQDFNKFINMLFINRNGYVVMDSDLSTNFTESDLSDNKQRVIKECNNARMKYWVTAGRTIENYLSNETLTKFAEEKISRSKFSKIETYCNKYKNKVIDSKRITTLMEEGEIEENFSLEEKIKELHESIISWN